MVGSVLCSANGISVATESGDGCVDLEDTGGDGLRRGARGEGGGRPGAILEVLKAHVVGTVQIDQFNDVWMYVCIG